jgi:hypothetical protein
MLEKYLIKIVKLLEEINAKLDREGQAIIGIKRRVPVRVQVPRQRNEIVRRW